MCRLLIDQTASTHLCKYCVTLQAEFKSKLDKWNLRNDDLRKQVVSSPDKLKAVRKMCHAIHSALNTAILPTNFRC